MLKRNNKPFWLVLTLIVLGVLVAFLANIIKIDGNTDEAFRTEISVFESEG